MDEQERKFRLELFRTEHESASKRLAELNAAKLEMADRLADHLAKLSTLPLAEIETWAAKHRLLEDAIAALNEIGNPAAAREREAESNLQLAQRNYGA